MATKTTKKESFQAIRTILEGANRHDLVQVIDHEIELLDKKSASRKPSKAQVANAELTGILLEVLEGSFDPLTILEIQGKDERLQTLEDGTPISNQRMSALLRPLVANGTVIRTEEKKKAKFALNRGQDQEAEA
ncbi:MAG: hypothetical protein II388_02625 [Clostridia bacterium]|nr:hypothetical protein [Clostridia bacterium]